MKFGFGSVLQACRERSGMSQEKLAELLNRSRSCISKFEKDHKLPDAITFLNFLDKTHAKDVGVAFLSGLDPAAILQTVFQVTGVA